MANGVTDCRGEIEKCIRKLYEENCNLCSCITRRNGGDECSSASWRASSRGTAFTKPGAGDSGTSGRHRPPSRPASGAAPGPTKFRGNQSGQTVALSQPLPAIGTADPMGGRLCAAKSPDVAARQTIALEPNLTERQSPDTTLDQKDTRRFHRLRPFRPLATDARK